MNPLVSVIIPTYNSAKYIKETLDSVFNQTYKNIEVIVVDDGSVDNTREILEKYNSKIKYIYQGNKGPSAARNRGIKEARGSYIAFLDSDDLWLPEKLEKHTSLFMKNLSLKLTYCAGYYEDEKGSILKTFSLEKYSQQKLIEILVTRNCIGSASRVIVDKECFDKVGLFDERLEVAEDWDMWLRICRKFEFRCINKPLVKIRVHKGSQSYFGDKNLKNELKFLNKIFSDKSLKRKWILKRKAYGYRYYSAAIAYRENGEREKVRECILKSFHLFPLGFFNKSHLALVVYAIFGNRGFKRLQRTINYFRKDIRYNDVR